MVAGALSTCDSLEPSAAQPLEAALQSTAASQRCKMHSHKSSQEYFLGHPGKPSWVRAHAHAVPSMRTCKPLAFFMLGTTWGQLG